MKIDDTMVDRVANLARLELTGEEKQRMLVDMNKILDFMSVLNEIDTTGVEPLVYLTDGVNNTREDEVKQIITHEEALLNAPEHDKDFFLVPKVIDIK